MHAFLLTTAAAVFLLSAPSQMRGQEVPATVGYRIVSCTAEFVGLAYSTVGETTSIPPHPIKKRSGFVYEITISVGLTDDVHSSTDPFGVVCRLPDGRMKAVTLNESHGLIEGVVPVSFVFRIETAEKGVATFQIGVLRLEGNEVKPVPDAPPNMRSSVFLD